MSKASITDKLGILFSESTSSILHILLFVLLIALGITLLATNKKNKKRNKKIYLMTTIVTFSIVVVTYHGSLSNIFDYMMNNLFIAIYFPNLAIYLGAIILTNIILWVSVFNSKTSDIIKKVNIIIYIIMNYLLFLVLGIINQNNLDVFIQKSVYENEKASALIELSSVIFITWILFLTFYKIILSYIKGEETKKIKKVIVKQREKILPENFIPTISPEIIYKNVKDRTVRKENKVSLTNYYEDVVRKNHQLMIEDTINIEPILKEEKVIEKESNLTEFDRMLLEHSSIITEKEIEDIHKMEQEQVSLEPIIIEEPKEEEMEETTLEELETSHPVVEIEESINEEQVSPIFEETITESNPVTIEPTNEETSLEEYKKPQLEINNMQKINKEVIREEVVEEPILIPIEEKDNNRIEKSIEETLTIEDYKLLLRMLKEQKEKERLEEIRRQEREREQDKFMELQSLYGNVR